MGGVPGVGLAVGLLSILAQEVLFALECVGNWVLQRCAALEKLWELRAIMVLGDWISWREGGSEYLFR